MDTRIMFEELWDSFCANKGDSIIIEDVNVEAGRNWKRFLDAGCDADKVVEMMSAKDIWDNYDGLTEAGVAIDTSRFCEYEELFENYGIDKDSENYFEVDTKNKIWTKLIERGFSAEEWLERAHDRENNPIINSDELRAYLSAGVDPKKVFEYSKSWIIEEILDTSFDAAFEMVDILLEEGLPGEEIKAMLDENIERGYILDQIVGFDACFIKYDWSKIGIDPKDYLEKWLEMDYIKNDPEEALEKLPKGVTQEQYISRFTAKELFANRVIFFEELYEGDPNIPARILVEEYGYPKDVDNDTLLDIYGCFLDSDATAIDLGQYTESVKSAKKIGKETRGLYWATINRYHLRHSA